MTDSLVNALCYGAVTAWGVGLFAVLLGVEWFPEERQSTSSWGRRPRTFNDKNRGSRGKVR
jgi:hypothetical protein